MKEIFSQTDTTGTGYEAWLGYPGLSPDMLSAAGPQWFDAIVATESNDTIQAAAEELQRGLRSLLGVSVALVEKTEGPCLAIGTFHGGNPLLNRIFDEETIRATGPAGFAIQASSKDKCIAIGAAAPAGVLYGVFHLLRLLGTGNEVGATDEIIRPANSLRMINHWDNFDGTIERGYAGGSFLYENNQFSKDDGRLRDYARLMSSVGINAICINNVNVHNEETYFVTDTYLPDVARIAAIFRIYGIQLYLSINFAAPLQAGGLGTADPLDPDVRQWWRSQAAEVYKAIPDFGGFVVKADSENRPGPFTYERDHADGANMLAEALQPYNGIVIWRCFVYNCKQDWRDRTTDRARAAYDHFKPLDGRFSDNVVLQIKNGPLDFQVREPVSPLFGALERTNQVLELQITQEYTGQQRHLCYLVPQWKEILSFNTYAKGADSQVKHIADGSLWGNRLSGIAAVSNTGNALNWTGHLLAQANLYGYGRLVWNPELSAEQIAIEWVRLTFGSDERVIAVITQMLMDSWGIYEAYTAPLGVGWMVNPGIIMGRTLTAMSIPNGAPTIMPITMASGLTAPFNRGPAIPLNIWAGMRKYTSRWNNVLTSCCSSSTMFLIRMCYIPARRLSSIFTIPTSRARSRRRNY